MQLLLGLSAVATLVSFLFILWALSGPLSLAFIGINADDARLHGLGGAGLCLPRHLLANLVGRRLIPLNFDAAALEADFRFALVRVRENAEGIALYHGEAARAPSLVARFADVFTNGWRVLLPRPQLAFYQTGYASSPSSSPTW